MTVTISRLYDSYAQATEAVSNLEKAGVPHSETSALFQTILIIGILKIPPGERRAVPPSIVIAME